MYNSFQLGLKYLQYYLTASNGKGHGTHSPFVFNFITRVLNDKEEYEAYEKIESLRKKLLQDNTAITVEDLGAGTSDGSENKRTIARIAARAAKPAKYGKLLYRMVKHYRPHTIIELGTSLGITASYLSSAAPASQIIT